MSRLPTDDTEDTKPDFENQDHEYIGRMQQLGLMDHFGCWTDAGIREAIK